jgi:hypothetical protein
LGFIGKLAGWSTRFHGCDRRTFDLPVRRHRQAGYRAAAKREGQPLRSQEPRHRRDDPGAGHRRNLGLPNGLFPFKVPVFFPDGIPAIVFAAIVGILLNLLFILVPPSLFGVKERANIE